MKEPTTLKPTAVWQFFEQICQVPRPSYKTRRIQQWLVDFAEKRGLEYVHDKAGNVIIRKPASAGRENACPVILQGHVDMVCEKNGDVVHDFEKDPIDWYLTEDGWMTARGTTLGADNGIGMALSLAVLDDDSLSHGPLECLFTVDEEVGLVGAAGLEPGVLKGKALINLDNEDDGYICIGCAGGVNTMADFHFETEKLPDAYFSFKLAVKGLQGGHSGSDINLGRGNANRLLVRFLKLVNERMPLRISEFRGGNLSNAIPREAYAVGAVPFAEKENLRVMLNLFEADIRAEYGRVEPDIQWTLESFEAPSEVLLKPQSDAFLSAMYVCPDGVVAMSNSVEGLVETSSNLASVKPASEHCWTVTTSQRSSLNSAKRDIVARVSTAFSLAGMDVRHTEGYPGWAPNPDSRLLKVMVSSYERLFGQSPVVYAIHAGLECGLFLEKYPQLDMVSYGPAMYGVHSPDEKVYVPSVEKAWNWLVDVLEQLD